VNLGVARAMEDASFRPGTPGFVSLSTNRYSLYFPGSESEISVLTPDQTTLASMSIGTSTSYPGLAADSAWNMARNPSTLERAAVYGSPSAGSQRAPGTYWRGDF
jgi:hypothetical protein